MHRFVPLYKYENIFPFYRLLQSHALLSQSQITAPRFACFNVLNSLGAVAFASAFLVSKEDIIITRNGKRIARLTGENEDLVSTAKSLFGILPGDATVEEAREEKMQRYERND